MAGREEIRTIEDAERLVACARARTKLMLTVLRDIAHAAQRGNPEDVQFIQQRAAAGIAQQDWIHQA